MSESQAMDKSPESIKSQDGKSEKHTSKSDGKPKKRKPSHSHSRSTSSSSSKSSQSQKRDKKHHHSKKSHSRNHSHRNGSRDRHGHSHHHSSRHHHRDYSHRQRDSYRDDPRWSQKRPRVKSPSPVKTGSTNDGDQWMRTVFLSNLHYKLDEYKIKQFFRSKGVKVNTVSFVKDKSSHKMKGLGYVELSSMEDVDLAILLTGTKIEGLHISVQRVGVDGLAIESAQIKAQQSGSTQQGASGGQGVGQKLEGKVIGPGNELISAAAQQKFNQQLVQAARSGARIIVSNIHPITEEAEIRKLFSQFGEIQSLKMTEVQSEDIEDDKEEKKKKKEKEDKQKEKKQKQKEKQKKKEKKWKDDEDEEEDKSSDDKTNGDADALEEFINTKVTKSAIIEYPTMMEAAEAVNVMNGAVILIPIIVTLDCDYSKTSLQAQQIIAQQQQQSLIRNTIQQRLNQNVPSNQISTSQKLINASDKTIGLTKKQSGSNMNESNQQGQEYHDNGMEGEPLLDDDFEVIKFGSKPRFDSKRPDPRNTSSQPTRNFMLSNMFDGFSIEPDELQEIVKDVVSECERFGHVTSAVPMLSADGILIIFEDAACAQNAFRIMNNRWFDKRQIQASYLAE